MAKVFDRVKVAPTTTGPGTVTLGAAETSFRTFAAAGAVNGDDCVYVIEDGLAWEIGTGIYSSTGPTLTRNVIASSDGTTALNLTTAARVMSTPIKAYLDSLLMKATIAQIRAMNTDLGPSLTGIRDAVAPVALTDAVTVAVDATQGINFTLTVVGNRTIGNPTGLTPGRWITIRVQGNDATLRTLAFGNQFVTPLPAITDMTSTKPYFLTIYCETATSFRVAAHGA